MIRVEIVGNRSVQEDLFEELGRREFTSQYTLIPVVHGDGNAGPRRGDHVWPEENFLLFAYVDDAEARRMREAVDAVRTRFPDEGIRLFAVPGERL